MSRSVLGFVGWLCLAALPAAAQGSGLEGTWRFAEVDRPLRLTFAADYSYQVDWNGDGTADIHGIYEFWDGRLVMRDEYPGTATECVAPGVYTYRMEGGRLTFQLYADDCRPRKATLPHPFVRQGH